MTLVSDGDLGAEITPRKSAITFTHQTMPVHTYTHIVGLVLKGLMLAELASPTR
jgi:hypothetical protein